MIPSIGRIVHYTLTEMDAAAIAQRRQLDGRSVGNTMREGDVYPMVIVRVWGDTEGSLVNGQVLLDGPDTLWVTSVGEGTGPRTWAAPPRVG